MPAPKPSVPTSQGQTLRRVLVPIANGTEEIELTCVTDVLSRFGAEVVTASVEEVGRGTADGGGDGGGREGDVNSTLVCRMSRGLKIVADTTIQSAAHEEWDLIALPGGINGSRNLRSSEHLMSLLKRHSQAKRLCGAICAAPAIVLSSSGLLGQMRGATCYPAKVLRMSLPDASDEDVVVQGNLVTSQGPGTALKFALQLGEELFGKEKANKVAKQLLVDRHGRFEKVVVSSVPKSLGLGLLSEELEESKEDSEAGNQTRKRKHPDSDESDSENGECVIEEAQVFREVLWPTLNRFGWTMEKRSKQSDIFYYCQPGFKRKDDIPDEAQKGIYFFDNRRSVLRCLAKKWSWNADVQQALQTYTACMERMADLVAMGKISPNASTVASITAEVAKNAKIAEAPLFDSIVLPQLGAFGWNVVKGSRTRKGRKTSYFPPHANKNGEEGVDYFVSRQQVLDFIRYDDIWGSMDEILRCLDVYQACVAVGNELHREGKLREEHSVDWLIGKAKERRPALPVVPGKYPLGWVIQKDKEPRPRLLRPASVFSPDQTQCSSSISLPNGEGSVEKEEDRGICKKDADGVTTGCNPSPQKHEYVKIEEIKWKNAATGEETCLKRKHCAFCIKKTGKFHAGKGKQVLPSGESVSRPYFGCTVCKVGLCKRCFDQQCEPKNRLLAGKLFDEGNAKKTTDNPRCNLKGSISGAEDSTVCKSRQVAELSASKKKKKDRSNSINALLDEMSTTDRIIDQAESQEEMHSELLPPEEAQRPKKRTYKSKNKPPVFLREMPANNVGPGWTVRTYQRQSGKYSGTEDRYWFSPETKKKFRSQKQIRRFLEFLDRNMCIVDGREREEAAWEDLKQTTR